MGTHAIVLGGSMAGLGAVRALSSHFDRVTLVERDALANASKLESRKGVPQGNHGHGLLASGYRVLDDYFPGMMQELIDEGASTGDVTGDFLWYQFGGWKLRADSGLVGIVVSRPCLEAKVRERVTAIKNVAILAEHDVLEPLFTGGRVTGVRIKNRASGEISVLDGDLVVDTLGRGSPAPKWLASWGFGEVKETLIKANVGYATGVFPRQSGDFYGSIGGIIAGTPPVDRRGAAMFAVEGGRWVVTLIGFLGDFPETELNGFREFARSLPTPHVLELIGSREPLQPLHAYRFPANQRRHYDVMSSFPEGFLVLGDAICSFNPAYGQGMSVALLEARALDDCLRDGRRDLARRFFKRAMPIVDIPWTIATGEDLRFPEVIGPRPPGFALLNRYLERAHQASAKDPVVLRRFFEVGNLLRPPTAMLMPDIAYRVLLGGRGVAQASPARKSIV
jgi:2-polyprenyl-6-methoxyphenol hydroxylase-like FAD-dependent oxidoreductase